MFEEGMSQACRQPSPVCCSVTRTDLEGVLKENCLHAVGERWKVNQANRPMTSRLEVLVSVDFAVHSGSMYTILHTFTYIKVRLCSSALYSLLYLHKVPFCLPKISHAGGKGGSLSQFRLSQPPVHARPVSPAPLHQRCWCQRLCNAA
jgi:hypothetical protein